MASFSNTVYVSVLLQEPWVNLYVYLSMVVHTYYMINKYTRDPKQS